MAKEKHRKKGVKYTQESSDSEGVDEFTKNFMSKTKHLKKKKLSESVESGSSSSEEENSDRQDSDTSGEKSDSKLDTSEPHPSIEESGPDRTASTKSESSQKRSLRLKTGRNKNTEDKQITDSDSSASDTSGEDDDDPPHGKCEDQRNSTGDESAVSMQDSSDLNMSDSTLSEDDDKLESKSPKDDVSLTKEEIDDGFSKLRTELADLSFSELQQLKEKIGIKAFNQAMSGHLDTSTKKQKFKRDNKNRPMELTSKRPVPRFREVVQVKKKTHRDPRFDDLSGEYDDKIFKQNYSFLGDVKQREKQKLLQRYHKEKDTDKRQQIEGLVKRMNEQERLERDKEVQSQRERGRKSKEMQLVKQGKRPYYLKKGDEKKLDLAEKFQELKKSGKVDAYIAKKRKKTTAKDRKHLPRKPSKFS